MCVHAQSFSRVQLFGTPWTVANQAPLSIEFSGVRLLFPTPRGLPNPGIELKYPALAGGFFTISTTWESQ